MPDARLAAELDIPAGRTAVARFMPRPRSPLAARAVAAGRVVQVFVGAGPGRVGRAHRVAPAEARLLAAELLAAADQAVAAGKAVADA